MSAPVYKSGSQGAVRELRSRVWATPKHRALTTLAVVVVLVLGAELFVRWIEPQLPIVRAGDDAEMIIKARRITEMGAHDPQVDVVFFGTSMMDSAVDPEAFLDGSTRFDSVYNAGVVGAPTRTQVRWASEVVLPALDPDVIVLGIHPIDLLVNDVLNLNIQPQQADVVFAGVLRETKSGPIGAVERYANDHSVLVQQRGNLRRPELVLEATRNTITGTEPQKFIPKRTQEYWEPRISPLGESALFHGDEFNITGVKDQLRENLKPESFSVGDVHKLFEATLAEGAQVVVVIPPIPTAAWGDVGIDFGALASGTALIRQIAAQYDVPVIDFSSANYDNALFADLVHTNERGAERLSRDLARQLDALEPAG